MPFVISLKVGRAYWSPLHCLAHSLANSPPCSAKSPFIVIYKASVHPLSVCSGLDLDILLLVGAFCKTLISILFTDTTCEYKLTMLFDPGSSRILDEALFYCIFLNLWLICMQSKSFTATCLPSFSNVRYCQFIWLISSICFLHMWTSLSTIDWSLLSVCGWESSTKKKSFLRVIFTDIFWASYILSNNTL